MCGIAGILATRPWAAPELQARSLRMASRIEKRGPDDQGLWISECRHVALVHRRLSIVDLSPMGHQPMVSCSGRYMIVFNGEIYNHREIRRELAGDGQAFRGSSDTEVLLAAIERWGLPRSLRRSVGMFAVAVWDLHLRELHLARDRFGEKPLHVIRSGSGLVFASDLRAIVAGLGRLPPIDRCAKALFHRYGYVPEPRCIFEGGEKVAPGTIQTWQLDQDGRLLGPRVERFWSIDEDADFAPPDTAACVDLVHSHLQKAISDQMMADVPVGCLLSGGIDSTAVAAVMQSISAQPIRTFSVAFDDPQYNEGPYARAVAEHLGTDHVEVEVSSEELISLARQMPSIYDEPFADSSQIPMVAVARETRRHVTVALTGDGGDELFGGYNRYYWPRELLDRVSSFPRPMRRLAGGALRGVARRAPGPLLETAGKVILGGGPIQDFRGKLIKGAGLLKASDLSEAYLSMMWRWDLAELGFAGCDDVSADQLREMMATLEPLEAMTGWDLRNYLPGDNLVKVDRASMSVGLEMRAPLLDHRLCGLARGMIRAHGYSSFKAQPKWPLRELVYRLVPRSLVERPKMGFSVPIAGWLRNELRSWAGELLHAGSAPTPEDRVAEVSRRCFQEHIAGNEDHSSRLWAALMFCQWQAEMERSFES